MAATLSLRLTAAALLLLTAGLARDARADGDDLRARAVSYTTSLTRASTHVQGLLRAARQRGYAPEVRCVDEGLSRVDTAAREAASRDRALVDALSRNDARTAEEQLAAIHASYTRGREAAAGADRCVGASVPVLARGNDATEVRVIVDKSLPSVAVASAP